jgi:putative endopeptidase
MMRVESSIRATLLLAGACALAACAGSSKSPAPAEPTPVAPETPATPVVTPVGTPPAPAEANKPEPPDPNKKLVTQGLAEVGIDASAMDPSANPCDDFYRFACGGWLAKVEIPADKSSWDRFDEIFEQVEIALHKILDESVKADAKKEPVKARLGTFYAACMDEAGIEKLGVTPVKAWLDKIAKIKDVKGLQAVVTELHRNGISAGFGLGADQDAKDTTRIVAQMGQGGLGMPDRDYYFKDDADAKALRERYVDHVTKMLMLSGLDSDEAKKATADVMDVESALAKMSLTRVQLRDPEATYHKLTRADLAKEAPGFDWSAYLDASGAKGAKDVIIHDVPYFKGFADMQKTVALSQWKSYLRWHVISDTSPALSKALVDENFAWKKAVTGQAELEPRWKRCVHATEDALGEDLGQEFIKVMFPGESKDVAMTMVKAIEQAFSDELPSLTWMDEETRKHALEKLATFAPHIGYPSKWKKYDFKVQKGQFFANELAGTRWIINWQMNRIGKPVDREEWGMFPQTVNAYYNPTKNEIVFPAAILQPPFFSAKSSVAVNLGGIGMIIGHELTHGFDDQGAQFAPDGNLKKWWSEDAVKKFQDKTACIEKQYGQYEPLPGLKLNGKLTMGENIADNGGTVLAYRAYRTLRKDAPETVVADGFTEDQQFFLAMGQSWCGKMRDELTRRAVVTDPHSIDKFRVVGSLSNMPEFTRAFGCAAGTKMRPSAENMCKVW